MPKNENNNYNLKQQISLSVKATQHMVGNEPSVIEFITVGTLYNKDDINYIIYEESELSGLPNHKTCLKLEEDSLKMSRFGKHQLRLLFRVGQKQRSIYYTPEGRFTLEYLTNQIELDIGEDRGSVKVDYGLAIGGLGKGNNILELNYHTLENQEGNEELNKDEINILEREWD